MNNAEVNATFVKELIINEELIKSPLAHALSEESEQNIGM